MTSQERKLSRRDFIRLSALAALSGLVSACEDNPAVQAVLASAQADLRPSPTPDQPVKFELIPSLEAIPAFENIPFFEKKIILDASSLKQPPEDSLNKPEEIIVFPEGTFPNYFSKGVNYWWEIGSIGRWSKKFNLEPKIIAAIMQIESGGCPILTSTAGAKGLFQIMPFHLNESQNPFDPETSALVGLNFFVFGLALAKKKGYKDTEALVQAAIGYNGGHGRIGLDFSSLPSETQLYARLFRAFITGDKGTIDWFLANATWMNNEAEKWIQQQKNIKQTRESGMTEPEVSRQKLDLLLNIPYKESGYRDNQGRWCTWDGQNVSKTDSLLGLNCGGFLLEAARSLFGKIELETIKKQPLAGRPASDPDWLWYGYDEVVSLAVATQGKIFKTEGLDWKEGAGFSTKDWKKIGPKLRINHVYFASINRPERSTGRIHHHVALILPTERGVLVYEAINPQSQVIVLEDFLRRYLNSQDYRIFLTESPLYLENTAENSKVYDKQKGAFLPTVGPVYLQGNILLRQSVGSENGSLNSWFVHGNRNYEGVPSWLGQDFVTKSENKTIVSPIEGVAEPGVDPNAGYFISIKGINKHAGLHLRIIHLKQENRPSGQIGVGQKIGTEGPQKHVHVICLWGNGDFSAENKDVPLSLLLEPKNQPTGTYLDKNNDGSNFIEFYAPSDSKFSWFELKN